MAFTVSFQPLLVFCFLFPKNHSCLTRAAHELLFPSKHLIVLSPTASDYPSTFYFITDASFSKSTVTCADANQWWGILISKWVVSEPTPKPHPWFVGTSGTSCCGLGSLGCRL